MLKLIFGHTTRIGVSKAGVGLVGRSGPKWTRRHEPIARVAIVSDSGGDVSQTSSEMVEALISMMHEARLLGTRMSIVLHDQLVRYFMVRPASNTRCLQDCRDAASARFHDLYGDVDTDWELRGDWRPSTPFLVCAIPRHLLLALAKAAAECKSALVQLAPHFIVAWNRVHDTMSEGDWILVADEGAITIGATDSNGLCGVRSVVAPLDPDCCSTWLKDLLSQIALQGDVPVPRNVRLVGDLPLAWTDNLACPVSHDDPELGWPTNSENPALVRLALSGRQH